MASAVRVFISHDLTDSRSVFFASFDAAANALTYSHSKSASPFFRWGKLATVSINIERGAPVNVAGHGIRARGRDVSSLITVNSAADLGPRFIGVSIPSLKKIGPA